MNAETIGKVSSAIEGAAGPIKRAISESIKESTTEGDVRVIVPVIVVIVGNRIIVDREWDWEKETG